MTMTGIYALTIVFSIFAIGDLVSAKTKASLSQPFVAAVLLLIYYWLGFPKTLVSDAGVGVIGSIATGILIASVGTTIDFHELIGQWKTIIISVGSVVVGVLGIIFVGAFFIGREQAIAGAPIFAGSISAVMIMSEFFNGQGLEHLSALCSMLLTLQTFVGLPLSTIMLRKAAADFVKNPANIENYKEASGEKRAQKKLFSFLAPSNSSIVLLAKLGITASIANFLAGLTGGVVHYLVMALFVGIIFSYLGFLEKDAMSKTGCYGIFLVFVLASLFQSFSYITPQEAAGMLFPVLVVLGLGSLFTGLMALILAKAMKMNPFLAIALGLTCMYGFPTTLFISQDIAKAYGKTEKEYAALSDYIVPKVVTAGIATVTIASGIIASWAVKMF